MDLNIFSENVQYLDTSVEKEPVMTMSSLTVDFK